jgi:hypothetical protein
MVTANTRHGCRHHGSSLDDARTFDVSGAFAERGTAQATRTRFQRYETTGSSMVHMTTIEWGATQRGIARRKSETKKDKRDESHVFFKLNSALANHGHYSANFCDQRSCELYTAIR